MREELGQRRRHSRKTPPAARSRVHPCRYRSDPTSCRSGTATVGGERERERESEHRVRQVQNAQQLLLSMQNHYRRCYTGKISQIVPDRAEMCALFRKVYIRGAFDLDLGRSKFLDLFLEDLCSLLLNNASGFVLYLKERKQRKNKAGVYHCPHRER